ncbi:hypothetical protein [Eubacterium coprostanoligenes]|uniref:hypothetical protein n=1 Tax=Eubacterium coprostanoligenes TaxID=290054 RepID=UPI002A82F90F|nr:hypothetical protein [Eubacterium coprostanoligenes]MDY4698691.1 hypothetical protein [Eubacterium coprostanoligenes]
MQTEEQHRQKLVIGGRKKSRCKFKQLQKISAHGQRINICINHQCRRRTDYPCRNEKKKRTIIAIAIAAIMFFCI